MSAASEIPIISGFEALKLYAALFSDPVGIGLTYSRHLGTKAVIRPPFSTRAEARAYLALAKAPAAESVLNDPAAFKTVGVAPIRGPKGSAQRRLRNGIVRMNGPQQQALRRAYAPPLSKRRLADQTQDLRRLCSAEIGTWPRDQIFDATNPVTQVMRKAAADLLFRSDDSQQALHVAELLDCHSRLQYSLKTSLFPVDLPGTPYRTLLRHAGVTEAALIDWIKSQHGDSQNLVGCIAHMQDADGAEIDFQGRAAQLWTLYGASFETTATALRWTLLHLAWNADVQQRLSEEVFEMGEASPYLEAVVLESLRMTPPVAYQLRRVAEPMHFEGYGLNRGDHVVICAMLINRDPDVYENPGRFLPERWLSMEAGPMRPLAFSAGPRRCLGFNFAMMVLKAALAELYATSVIDIPDASRIDVRLAITQSPKRVPIILKRREIGVRASRFSGKATRQMTMVSQN